MLLMANVIDSALLAVGLLWARQASLMNIVTLSLTVSLSASIAAAVVGLPLGAALAIFEFRGRSLLILIANALLGLPPVVVGLLLYLLLSRSGPLGWTGMLFTPAAMALAHFLLALPIVIALSQRPMTGIWREYGDQLLVDGVRRLQAIPFILTMGRLSAITASLAGFGRAISEVGAILIVGGNIAGYTRTMTTAITLETSQGNFVFALALGAVLVTISIVVSVCAFGIEAWSRRRDPKETG
jgi:tungstate transport system permease protein